MEMHMQLFCCPSQDRTRGEGGFNQIPIGCCHTHLMGVDVCSSALGMWQMCTSTMLIVHVECKSHGHLRPRGEFSTISPTMVEYEHGLCLARMWILDLVFFYLESLILMKVDGGKSNPLFTKSAYGSASVAL